MKISYQWLSELVDLKNVSPAKLAELLTARGLEVEEIDEQGRGFDKVVSAHILDKGKHPNSDRLSYCKVDVGGGKVLNIVCGAQNHKTGDKVVLAMIGADLPNGLKIGKSKIRDVESEGMLCSEAELGLSKESAGIIILPPDTPIGKPIAEVLGRTDTVLTLKLYANQSHCLSHYGVAREVAAGLGIGVAAPKVTEKFAGTGSPIAIELKAGEKAPQFYGLAIDGVRVGPSPEWVRRKLEAVGSRSINNVVDATNLVMLELGHPVHAYDAEKIGGHKIGVRLARPAEKLPLLDGTEAMLEGTEIVIFDGRDKAIGLAGVMGGGNSEVSDGTKKVFLECAEFDPVLVRKAKVKHQKLTEAATRFEKGIDPQGLERVITRLATLIIELAGGKAVGSAKAETVPAASRAPKAVAFAQDFIPRFLGVDVSAEEIARILGGLNCQVEKAGAEFRVTPPSYRLDLRIREDFAEEVARTLGYDAIPATIPKLSGEPATRAWSENGANAILLDRAKQALVAQGLCETLNYGFGSGKWLAELGFASHARVLNPLSEEHEYMVPSLVPGLVQNALTNWNHHFGSERLPIRLFEIRPTFHFEGQGEIQAVSQMETQAKEKWKVAFAVSGPRYARALKADEGTVDFADLRAIVDGFFAALGTKGIRYIPLAQSRQAEHPVLKLLHPGQAVEVLAGNQSAGHFGLAHPRISRGMKFREPLWIGEFDWDAVAKMSRAAHAMPAYKAWNEFPSMERDYALVVDETVTAEKVLAVIAKAGKPLAKESRIFDVYKGAQVPAGKVSIAARVAFWESGRSLQEAETEAASQKIVEAFRKELGAELR